MGRWAAILVSVLSTAGCPEPGGGQVSRAAPAFRIDPGETISLVLHSELTGPAVPQNASGGAGWTEISIQGVARGPSISLEYINNVELVLTVSHDPAPTASTDPWLGGPSAWSDLIIDDGAPGESVRWLYSGGVSSPSFGFCEPAVPCVEQTRLDLFWNTEGLAIEAPPFEVTITAFVSSDWAPLSAQSTASLEVGWRAP